MGVMRLAAKGDNIERNIGFKGDGERIGTHGELKKKIKRW